MIFNYSYEPLPKGVRVVAF